MQDETVVVTGMGVVSSIGTNLETFVDALRKGKTGLTPLKRFDPAPYPNQYSFEIVDFKLEGKRTQELLRINRSAQYAIAAAQSAMKQCGHSTDMNPFKVGIVLGSSFLDLSLVTRFLTDVLKSQLKDYRPLLFPNTVPNATAAHVAIELNVRGPNITVLNKQNGAFAALDCGIRLLRMGRVEMVLVGGVDQFSFETFLYFQQLEKIAGVRGPELHVPFSKNRNGFLMGEGCGMLVLEKADHAMKRGAPILAEIQSVANVFFPCPFNDFLSTQMPSTSSIFDHLLSKAHLRKEEVNAFFACANSSIDIDAWEDEAIASYFGKELPVTAFSSFIGEASDASMLHLIAAIVCLREQFLFPVVGYEGNPKMGSNILTKGRESNLLNHVIVSRIGLGGSYSVCLLSRPAL